jgi:hypothetical protein
VIMRARAAGDVIAGKACMGHWYREGPFYR